MIRSRLSRSRRQALLQDYVAGDLSQEEAGEVEALLRADPKARALCDEARAAHDALTVLRDRSEPPVTAADVLSKIQIAIATDQFRAKPRLELQGEGTRFYRRLAIAATLLFAVSATLLGVHRFSRPGGNGDVQNSPVVVTTPPSERGIEMILNLDNPDTRELMERYRELKLDPVETFYTPGNLTVPISVPLPESR
ncbi:MAG: hypothetical protein V3T86_13785 [Planctomycetota bacterium]